MHCLDRNYEVYTSQTLTGLDNGTYTLIAMQKSYGEGLGNSYMEVKDYGGKCMQLNIHKSPEWTQISISGIEVTNGQCTIGFYSKTPAGRGYQIDYVEFLKDGSY